GSCRRPRRARCSAREWWLALRHPDAGRPGDGVLHVVSPFETIFVPDELAAVLADDAWVEAMLDAERALANAQALAGVLSPGAAAAVAEACGTAAFDASELARDGRAAGNPVEPLVRRLRERVGPEHGDAVHHGATSQDILDSAAMLVAK